MNTISKIRASIIILLLFLLSNNSICQISCANTNNTQCLSGDYLGWASSETQDLIIAHKRTTSPPNINFLTSNTQRMTILGTGNVGIGISTPQNLFHLDAGSLQITNATTGSSTAGKGLLIGQSSSGSANVEINQQENAPMNFLTNGAARLKIQSDGKVALGNYTTFTANSLLHQYVNSATETYHQFTNSTTGASTATTGLQVGIDANGNAIFKNNYSSGSNGAMNFYTNAAERMRISNSGLVGIGVASPVAQLDIATSALVTSGSQIVNDQTGNTVWRAFPR